jgi:SAM-dependent methyltransferase
LDSKDYSHLYDAFYYAHDCGLPYQRTQQWLDHFDAIAAQIVDRIGPRSVLDAGCAMGFLVEALRRREVEAYGVDISEYAISQVYTDVRAYCRVGSICDPFPQRYDLIVCIEILEHMPAAEAPKAIGNLCRYTDDMLFSSTPFDYKEMTHFNVQPPEYWAELFAGQGFFRDMDFDASFILPWAARFRRRKEPVTRLVREYERRFWLLWNENVDLRRLSTEMRGQIIEAETVRATAAEAPELRAELDWLRTQIRECRGSHRPGLLGGLRRLHFPIRVLGRRLIVRMPGLTEGPVSQTFVAEHANLCGLSVLVERDACAALSSLHIAVADADHPADPLIERTISPRLLPERGEFTLRFPAVPGSAGRRYRITLSVPEATPGEDLYVWRYARSGRPDSELRQRDVVLAGELVLCASYGVYPDVFADRWQPPTWSPSSLLNPAALIGLLIGALGVRRNDRHSR